MRTLREIYSKKPVVVYTCEWEECPRCGGPLEALYVSGPKTVQTLTGVWTIAQRPQRCADAECAGHRESWKSAQWQQVAPPFCTYGYDVIAQIGWFRQEHHQPFGAIHESLQDRLQIGESQVRRLYHHLYLPLLACEERQHQERLAAVARENGLLVALDGLAPEGGEAQLWVIREIQTGLTLRSGWLSGQDEATFTRFLEPLRAQGWRVKAVLSDKQRGLVPAVGAVFPEAHHAFCQWHYLQNAVAPLAAADNAMKVALRKEVRQAVGPLLRQEPVGESPGVLTVTGLVPSLLPGAAPPSGPGAGAEAAPPAAPEDPGGSPAGEVGDAPAAPGEEAGANLPPASPPEPEPRSTPPAEAPGAESPGQPIRSQEEPSGDSPAGARPPVDPQAAEREALVQDLLRRTRYLLTLKARPPLHLAGGEMVERLSEVVACLDRMLPQHPEARLEQLRAGLQQGLETVRPTYLVLRQAEEWVHQVRQILDPDGPSARTGEEVRQELWQYLDHLPEETSHPQLGEFGEALRQVTQNYDAGLFHTYDIPGLPRTNNGRESEFQNLKHRLLSTTGQKGAVRRLRQREGAWELIPRPATLEDTLAVLSRVAPDDLRQEQQRVQEHRNRFRLHVRAVKQSTVQLEQLEQRWATLHATRGP
jgi:hypothetical protein